jgi:hypothetical protein
MTADQLLQKLREAQRRVALENPNPKSTKEFNEMIDAGFILLLRQFEDEIRTEDAMQVTAFCKAYLLRTGQHPYPREIAEAIRAERDEFAKAFLEIWDTAQSGPEKEEWKDRMRALAKKAEKP